MQKEEIIKYAVAERMPEDEMTSPERALYYSLKDVYSRYRKGLITKEQGESLKNKALRQFDLDQGAFSSAMNIIRDNAAMWKRIEITANQYRLERNLDNADAFIEAVYNVSLKEKTNDRDEGN